MGNQTSRLLEAVFQERSRLISRRSMLKIGAASALTLGVAGSLPLSRMTTFAQDLALTSDLEVLNYALTLEHLEYAFYRDGIGNFTFGNDPFAIEGVLQVLRKRGCCRMRRASAKRSSTACTSRSRGSRA